MLEKDELMKINSVMGQNKIENLKRNYNWKLLRIYKKCREEKLLFFSPHKRLFFFHLSRALCMLTRKYNSQSTVISADSPRFIEKDDTYTGWVW